MGSISVNGVTYRGNNITINNDVVIIDGVIVGDENSKTINISVVGDISSLNVERCKEITVQGNVGTIVTTSGDIECEDVGGSIKTLSGDVKHRKLRND